MSPFLTKIIYFYKKIRGTFPIRKKSGNIETQKQCFRQKMKQNLLKKLGGMAILKIIRNNPKE